MAVKSARLCRLQKIRAPQNSSHRRRRGTRHLSRFPRTSPCDRDAATPSKVALLSDPPFLLLYWRVVDARNPALHKPCPVELPEFCTIRAVPLPRSIMPLVLEAHRHPVLAKSPERLLQPVVQLPRPLPSQKCPNLLPALQELRPIPPLRVFRIRQHHPFWIARVPQILGHLYLGNRTLFCKRRNNSWSHHRVPRFRHSRCSHHGGRESVALPGSCDPLHHLPKGDLRKVHVDFRRNIEVVREDV